MIDEIENEIVGSSFCSFLDWRRTMRMSNKALYDAFTNISSQWWFPLLVAFVVLHIVILVRHSPSLHLFCVPHSPLSRLLSSFLSPFLLAVFLPSVAQVVWIVSLVREVYKPKQKHN